MYFLLAVVLVMCDQITKWWVAATLPPAQSVPVLPPMLFFTYLHNPGAAFSLLPNQTPLLIGVALAAGLAAWWQRAYIARQSRWFCWGVTLALSGALGNLIDRVRLGAVVDFIDIRILPVFNVADMCIVAGVGLILLSLPDGAARTPR